MGTLGVLIANLNTRAKKRTVPIMKHNRQLLQGLLFGLMVAVGLSSCLPKNEPQETRLPSINFGFIVIDDQGHDLLTAQAPKLDLNKITITAQGKSFGVYSEEEARSLSASGPLAPKAAPTTRATEGKTQAPRSSNPHFYGSYTQRLRAPGYGDLPFKSDIITGLFVGEYDGEKSYPSETITIDWGDGSAPTVIRFSYIVKRENEKITITNDINLDGKKIDSSDRNQVYQGYIIIRRTPAA